MKHKLNDEVKIEKLYLQIQLLKVTKKLKKEYI